MGKADGLFWTAYWKGDWVAHTALANRDAKTMTPLITSLLLLFLGLLCLLTIIDVIRNRSLRRLLGHLALLLIAFVGLNWTTGFPLSSTRQAFGATVSPLLVFLVMFVCVLLGIAARYIFYLKGAFVWIDFVRPLVISPLILLPLLGSLQGAALEPLQMSCFAILAFQNGFFWQQVLQEAKPTTQGAQHADPTSPSQ